MGGGAGVTLGITVYSINAYFHFPLLGTGVLTSMPYMYFLVCFFL